ncbi:MAG TPA: DUF1549 and DUF1553 domain-containing protein [Gemmataceae bacterium]|nr:DUF1549 and DUF1553 domain-containing protein [Gemmataceae bacterium]
MTIRPAIARRAWAYCCAILALMPALAHAETSIESLSIEPARILLQGANRQQQIVVTAKAPGGKLLDVTHACSMKVADEAVARIAGTEVAGVADGATELLIRLGGKETRVPLFVKGFDQYPPVHFASDVVPLFSKLGCNSGGCHGKASGQNGFKLSVFGFAPEADYNALVKEARGRRVFPESPLHSLLIAKPTGRMAHGGGRRIDPGSRDEELLVEWIKQGMPRGADDAPRAVAIRVSPAERTLGLQAEQQILTTAVFSDGSGRDVTSAAGYTSNAEMVAEVDRHGLLHTGKVPGEAAITVNYMGHIAAVRIQVPRVGALAGAAGWQSNNKIDDLAWAKLRKMGIVPSPICDDATFLRRLYLDVIGTLPRPDEVRKFLADKRPDNRRQWIDNVLQRDEYADYWALIWADILLVNSEKLGDRGAFEFHRWLREQFAKNRPYDQWVRELITASGPSATVGPVNFYRVCKTPEEATRSLSQAFLGIRIDCAQCHHHPFEKWSQDDFYGMAGFFNGLEHRPMKGEGELVFHAGYRETIIPRINKPARTHPPDGPVPGDLGMGDPRAKLAAWMTKPDNPWFARLVANRLWKHYLGRGIVEPEDDLRSTNPATNEPLLDYLAKAVVDHQHDLKAVMRLILNSRVYQLSSVPNDTNRDDEQNFSHYRVKRLPAEVLLDAISAATESPETFPGRARGTRAIELWDNRLPSYFLEIFGRSERTSPCACARSAEPTMAQALHLMNAPEVEEKIADPTGRIARLLKAKASEAQIADEFCLATLGRPPGEKERKVANRLFRAGPSKEAAQDFLWALLNSYEFLFVQ